MAVTCEPHVETLQDALGKAQKVLQEANKRHSAIHTIRQKLKIAVQAPQGEQLVAKAYAVEFEGKINPFLDKVDEFSLKVGTAKQPTKFDIVTEVESLEEEQGALEAMMRDNCDYVKKVSAALE